MKIKQGTHKFLHRLTILTAGFLLTNTGLNGQKLNFANYSVEWGLGQSQVQRLVQDEFGFLWAGTLGGISRFNGKEFRNFTKRDGLASQIIYALEYQAGHGMWIGSHNGLQWFDGKIIRNITFPDGSSAGPIVDIVSGPSGLIYALGTEGRISVYDGNRLIFLEDAQKLKFFQITRDRNGRVYGLNSRAIYSLTEPQEIALFSSAPEKSIDLYHLYFDPRNNPVLITSQGVFRRSGAGYLQIPVPGIPGIEMTSVSEDAQGVLWIGTTSGAYRIPARGNASWINSQAGFTDSRIHDILTDKEGNIWFASDADGLYKLSPNSLEYLDESHGLNGKVVMSMATDNQGTVWLGSLDGGLTRYTDGAGTKLTLPMAKAEDQKINALHYDTSGTLWIGTIGSGLWALKNGQYRKIPMADGSPPAQVISLYEDRNHTIWVGTAVGLYFLEGETLRKVTGPDLPCFGMLEYGNDLLLGTASGLFKLSKDFKVSPVVLPGYAPGIVNCLAGAGTNILIGTEDDGVLVWDPLLDTIKQCSGKDGLSSDFVFSLYSKGPNHFFAGTGRGINEIRMEENGEAFRVHSFAKAHNLYGPECNLNAVLPKDNGEIWFGTTRGIYVYRNSETKVPSIPPAIYLSAVGLYPGFQNESQIADTLVAWSPIPRDLSLPPRKNLISFEFEGVSLSDPDGLRYRYQLLGSDDSLSAPVRLNRVSYPNLSPGTYRFRAIAMNPDGIPSANEIDYSFRVESPFYQTTWFRLLLISLLILTGVLFEYGRGWMRRKRLRLNEEIRREEQKLILERTSEDLHDDLGNKITRITVLADVLQRKIAPGDTDKVRLVNQIRENAQALYDSTRDILWTLTPGQDTLLGILEKYRTMGTQLFSDAEIEFQVDGMVPQMDRIKVPFSMARNLNMIVKEAFTNILKHSGASRVEMQVALQPGENLVIRIQDTGGGWQAGKPSEGKGLTNMQKRITRIGGSISFGNGTSGGFAVCIAIKIPPPEGY